MKLKEKVESGVFILFPFDTGFVISNPEACNKYQFVDGVVNGTLPPPPKQSGCVKEISNLINHPVVNPLGTRVGGTTPLGKQTVDKTNILVFLGRVEGSSTTVA